MMPISARPTARRIPAMMNGNVAGRITFVRAFLARAVGAANLDKLRAHRAHAAKGIHQTGNKPLRNTIAIFEELPSPNHRSSSGISATRGVASSAVNIRVEQIFGEAIAPHHNQWQYRARAQRSADSEHMQAPERAALKFAGDDNLQEGAAMALG